MLGIQEPALVQYLGKKDPIYYGKILELRSLVSKWLSAIPQTFPHYTSHTIEHSDEIILQVSKFLFRDNGPRRPVVNLSAVEAYICIVSAYLHDAGMIVSESEKESILRSREWWNWTSDRGAGARRWAEIEEFRAGGSPEKRTLRDFIADRQAGYLIAEYVRRTHHLRTASLIRLNEERLAGFSFDDPILMNTICNVCMAHGVEHYELEDQMRFPEEVDVRGETVNPRFLAMVLRLGDLLDMSNDRACPLLLNSLCPLPSGSIAHWTKYSRIVHRLTTPERVEIRAACLTQDEHKYLRDWCGWLVREIQDTTASLFRSRGRHSSWRPPSATLEGPGIASPTIVIRPDATATYLPHEWHFDLDKEAVLSLLIRDLYGNPLAFVRELLQNALDATRCRMYMDLQALGKPIPRYPTQVERGFRDQYPITISLTIEERPDRASGEMTDRRVLTVDDHGIGMDSDIIKRYFLQVGRSFYLSDEFRRGFSFEPTSNFGVGFLSVFTASDEVTVETFKPSSALDEGPVRILLTGPSNYLLTEKGSRTGSGTRITAVLRDDIDAKRLESQLLYWCRRVEFPVEVDIPGNSRTITAEDSSSFTYETSDPQDPEAVYAVRSFPIERTNLEGDVYVFVRRTEKGESWAEYGRARARDASRFPVGARRLCPNLICLHGIAMYPPPERGSYRYRVDFRGNTRFATASRNGADSSFVEQLVRSRLSELVTEHLAQTPYAQGRTGWLYRQELVSEFPLEEHWASAPRMIPLHGENGFALASLEEVERMERITTVSSVSHNPQATDAKAVASILRETPNLMTAREVHLLSDDHRNRIFRERTPISASWLSSDRLAIEWVRDRQGRVFAWRDDNVAYVLPLPQTRYVGFSVHLTVDIIECLVLNSDHEFVQWMIRFADACRTTTFGLSPESFRALSVVLDLPIRFEGWKLNELQTYLDTLRRIKGLPTSFKPPAVSESMFAPYRKALKARERYHLSDYDLDRYARQLNRPR